jgi:hypothetical protein
MSAGSGKFKIFTSKSSIIMQSHHLISLPFWMKKHHVVVSSALSCGRIAQGQRNMAQSCGLSVPACFANSGQGVSHRHPTNVSHVSPTFGGEAQGGDEQRL